MANLNFTDEPTPSLDDKVVGFKDGAAVGSERSFSLGNIKNLFGGVNPEARFDTYALRGTTTNATPTGLRQDDEDNSKLVIPGNTAWAFTIQIVAAKNDGSNVNVYWFRGRLKNVAGTVSMSSSLFGDELEDAAGWSVALSADDTDNALAVTVTGAASTTINWTARVDVTQVQWTAP